MKGKLNVAREVKCAHAVGILTIRSPTIAVGHGPFALPVTQRF